MSFPTRTNASEHLQPAKDEETLQAADDVGLTGLKIFRRLHPGMPASLEQTVLSVAGGRSGKKQIRSTGAALRLKLQGIVQYQKRVGSTPIDASLRTRA